MRALVELLYGYGAVKEQALSSKIFVWGFKIPFGLHPLFIIIGHTNIITSPLFHYETSTQ